MDLKSIQCEFESHQGHQLCPISPIGRGIWLRIRSVQVRILCGAPFKKTLEYSNYFRLIEFCWRRFLDGSNPSQEPSVLFLWGHSSVGESAELIPLESVEGSSPSVPTIWTDSLSGLSAGLKIQRMKVRHLLGPPICPYSSAEEQWISNPYTKVQFLLGIPFNWSRR